MLCTVLQQGYDIGLIPHIYRICSPYISAPPSLLLSSTSTISQSVIMDQPQKLPRRAWQRRSLHKRASSAQPLSQLDERPAKRARVAPTQQPRDRYESRTDSSFTASDSDPDDDDSYEERLQPSHAPRTWRPDKRQLSPKISPTWIRCW